MGVILTEEGGEITDETADRFRLLIDGETVVHGTRTNFLVGWYQEQQDDFQDVINFAEGRTDDPVFV